FVVGATPPGLTLAREWGAHQSINTPLIGMGQAGLAAFEPAYADELAVLMGWAFRHMQDEEAGGSVSLRLPPRQLQQPKRAMTDGLRAGVIGGAYWAVPPAPGADLAIAYC